MTEQQFKKKLVIRIIAGAALFAAGACLLLYAISSQMADDFKGGYTYGLIGGLTGAGFMTVLKNFIFLKNTKFFKKRYVAENDERNKQISLKAWAWSGYISMYAILASTLFMPDEAIKYVLCLTCIPLIIYGVVYKILQMKM